MHDLDRTAYEFESNGEFEYNDEWEMEDELEDEYDEFENEYESDEFEFEDEYEDEWESGDQMESESPFSESEEMELAAELLAVESEAELDQFLGGLIKKAAGGISRFAKSGVGKKVFGVMKGLAKKALPFAGKALGGAFGGPLGAMVGGKLGSFASRMFELEMEGMSAEDQEFEVARRIVRLGGQLAVNTAKAPRLAQTRPGFQKILHKTAVTHAPGLLKPARISRARRRGYWYRKGNRIVLVGA